MSNRKRILVLTPRFPYPVVGGDRLRIYNQCKVLSKYYDLTLLSLCETQEEFVSTIPNDGLFKKVERVLLSKPQSFYNSFLGLFSTKPLQVAYYRSKDFQKKVDEEVMNHDLVLCHLIRTTDYLKNYSGLKVAEMTDAISLNYQRVKENRTLKGFKAWIYRFEYKRLLDYECKILKQFNLCSLISQIDEKYLLEACDYVESEIVISGNGVQIDQYPFQFKPYRKSEPLRIVFIGAMNTLQNYDAAHWFASKILPLIANEFNVIFEVVGKISIGYKDKLSEFDKVKVVGAVESIPLTVKGAHIGVCPMRIGAGVQNKVLEYMALGLPCITTSLGLEGIKAVPDNHLLVADTPMEYVQQINNLIAKSEVFFKIAKSARNLVEEEYSWQKQQESFISRLNELLST